MALWLIIASNDRLYAPHILALFPISLSWLNGALS